MNICHPTRTQMQTQTILQTLGKLMRIKEIQFSMATTQQKIIGSSPKRESNMMGCTSYWCGRVTRGYQKTISQKDMSHPCWAKVAMGLTKKEKDRLFFPNEKYGRYTQEKQQCTDYISLKKAQLTMWYFYKTGKISWAPSVTEKYATKYPIPAL